jgi:hypothetical protein
MYRESYVDGGILVEKLDRTGLWVGDPLEKVRDATPEELLVMDAMDAEQFRESGAVAHRDALANAREILLSYGTPQGPTYPQALSIVQQAVLEYRDSDIDDAICDKHIMWINSRVNEINSAALFASGVLE